jgi:multimeric flavodoxin WrbA
MKKILIISTSIRGGSNSEILAHEFERGAKDKGNEVVFISLKDKKINFCKGCLACQKLGKCITDDDANAITDEMAKADVIVWVTPIYYYEMSGQMKTMIDRANSLYARPHNFKDVYLLTVAAEDEEFVPKRAISGVQGWVDCFEGVTLKEALFVGGVDAPNKIKNNENLLKAYELGGNV